MGINFPITIQILVVCIILLIVLTKPYLGLILTILSIPVVDLLPPVPYFTSIVILVGVTTLIGYFIHFRSSGRLQVESIFFLEALYVIWIFISNPQASFLGASRNWVFTFIQLLVLSFLSSRLLNSPKKQNLLILLFALVGAITGIVSIIQGNIGDTISTSFRAVGFSGNPNSNGRYLVVSMLFFYYLFNSNAYKKMRVFALFGILVTFFGVFFTLSRTSILLLFLSIGLIMFYDHRRRFNPISIVIFCIAFILLISFSDEIINILRTIVPSIALGTDTVGVRYKLWLSGLAMWKDHKLLGVGIDNYSNFLPYYANGLSIHYWFSKLHNTYLTALVETGFVGFILFMLIVFVSLKNFWKTLLENGRELNMLLWIWGIIYVIILFGEITANGLYDKMLWFLFGMSVIFKGSNKPEITKSQE